MSATKWRYFLPVGLILIGVIIGIGLTVRWDTTKPGVALYYPRPVEKSIVLGSQKESSTAVLQLQNTERAFTAVAQEVLPTVVSISAVQRVNYSDLSPYPNKHKDFWDYFNEKFFFRFKTPKEFRQGGVGSGIIVNPKGYILTNTHVVSHAENIKVRLYDDRTFKAKLIGIDPLTEVAAVKIEAQDLPVAKLGNSDSVEVGQWVLAVGNPLELSFTVTAGIVSAVGRQVQIITDNFGIENYIQTDAVINPGNSGGALVNLKAEVIGVNTAIKTRSGYYEGYGFAIPINLAKRIMEDLITKGRVVRPYLGIAMLPMDEKKAKVYGLEKLKNRGVFIDNVLKDGPAKDAGIRPEDILLELDGQSINRPNEVQSYIARHKPGEIVQLTLWRSGKKLTISVTLAERELPPFSNLTESESEENKQKHSSLGVKFRSLTRQEARELGGTDENVRHGKGVVVEEVEAFSAAYDAGLQRGDIILEANHQRIGNANSLEKLIRRAKSGDILTLLVLRANNRTHLFLEIP